MTKDEDQIAKDKEAIAKMVGAKSAMEAALRRIDGLSRALKLVQKLHEEAAKVSSSSARVLTHYNAGNNCSYSQDKKTIAVDDISAAIAAIVYQQTSTST
tara:strand:+ start:906 stop:1205 length:300 start_codon:yes stop_codon:yes gene_type:complete